jgi:hypothetical protein
MQICIVTSLSKPLPVSIHCNKRYFIKLQC